MLLLILARAGIFKLARAPTREFRPKRDTNFIQPHCHPWRFKRCLKDFALQSSSIVPSCTSRLFFCTMATALGGATCRRAALSERLISRVLSQLTLAATAPVSSPAYSHPHACQVCGLRPLEARRHAASSSQWKSRQSRDRYARQAKVQGLKSRAAWKLIEVCLSCYPATVVLACPQATETP